MNFTSVTGSEYDQCSDKANQSVSKLLGEHVFPKKNTYKKMLDLGCGTGSVTDVFIEFFKPESFIGVDLTENYLEFAKQCKRHSKIEINYEKCDLNNMEELKEILKKNPDIDIVVSSFVLHWVDDPIEIFKTLSTWLNGDVEHVHISVTDFQEDVIDLIERIKVNSKWAIYFQGDYQMPPFLTKDKLNYPSNEFNQTISNLKFEIFLQTFIPNNHEIESKHNKIVSKFLFPLSNLIPHHLREEFFDEFYAECSKLCQNAEGKAVWKCNFYILHAKR